MIQLFIFLFIAVIIISFIFAIKDIINEKKFNNKREQGTANNRIASINVSYESGWVKKKYPLLNATKIQVVRYYEYKVKGKNPATNRMKTNTVVVKNGTPEDIITQKSGLLETYTVTQYIDEPTYNQIMYAKNLNIKYPSDCNLTDVSMLISRQLDEIGHDFVNNDILEYASKHNVYVSPYADKVCGIHAVIKSLQSMERIVFFIYLIYCGKTKTKIGNMYNLPVHNVFYRIAETIPDIENTSKYIKEHYTDRLATVGSVDKRNKQMAQLYDTIVQHLTEHNVI